MFIRQEKGKVFIVQAVVHLLVLFLSINLLIGQAVSGKDIVISGDSRKPDHQEELSHYRSMDNSLRQRMEGDPRQQHKDARLSLHGMDRNAGRHGLEDQHYPTPKERVIGGGAKGINAESLTWDIEVADASRYFVFASSRGITVDANNYPHIVYGGDHLYYAHHDGVIWR